MVDICHIFLQEILQSWWKCYLQNLPFSHVVIYQALHTPRHNTVTNQLLAFTNLLLGCISYFNILFKYSCMTLLEPHGMNKEQTSFTLINASKSCLSLVIFISCFRYIVLTLMGTSQYRTKSRQLSFSEIWVFFITIFRYSVDPRGNLTV